MNAFEKTKKIREQYKPIFTQEAYPEKIFEQLAYYWEQERRSIRSFMRYTKECLPYLTQAGAHGAVQTIERMITEIEKEQNEI